jgi:hypothetical protein
VALFYKGFLNGRSRLELLLEYREDRPPFLNRRRRAAWDWGRRWTRLRRFV